MEKRLGRRELFKLGGATLLGAAVSHALGQDATSTELRPTALGQTAPIGPLQPVDKLIVDIALDNLSDSYSSKPHYVSAEFNNVMYAGACEISGTTLCCAQLGLALS